MSAGSEQISIPVLIRLREAVVAGLRDYYHGQGVAEVQPPLLVDVTGACENIDTLLAVSGSHYLNEGSGSAERTQQEPRGYLSQTGQLALETALAHCNACWCRTVSFRDDEPSPRHLREFELIEEEFGAAKNASEPALSFFDELLERVESVLRAGIASALETGAAAAVGVGTEHLTAALAAPFPRITYDEAIEIASTARSERGEPSLRSGQDLTPEDETAIIQRGSDADVPIPTMVTCFPTEIKFFNMKCDPRNPKRVLSADVLMPFAGETVGAAVREDDYESLVDRLVSSSMFRTLQARGIGTLEVFEPYLSLIRSKATPRHAGYGIGLDRLLQFIVGGSDIRHTSLAYRLGEGK
jgi:asparaginyl-tRNA synthetase